MTPIRKVLVVYYAENYGTLGRVKRALQKNGIAGSYVNRENEAGIKKHIRTVDAVIVVGGDGTLLRTSHFINDAPVLHVSSSTTVNEAFFARATSKDCKKKIGLLARGKYKISRLLRLEAEINGKKLPFKALNEVYAGVNTPYHTARYTLMIGSRKEKQKSSGIIICTPAGSHAWARSSGGKLLPTTARKMQYVVREPYTGRLTKPKMISGILEASGKITVVSDVWKKHSGVVVIDSYKKEFRFDNGDKLVVRAAKNPLKLISF